MKTKSLLALLFVVIIVMTACPYTSTVPIDQASIKVDKNLIGKWVKSSDVDAEKPNFYEIKSLSDKKYTIINNEYSTYDSTYTITNYTAHVSKIDDVNFLNMQKDGTGDYYLYRFELIENELTMFEVTDNIDEKFNTSQELRAFIQKNMLLSFFYNKDEIKYIRETNKKLGN
jgi:hypothetical protein